MSVQAYGNAKRPDNFPSPTWQLKFQIAFLYPKRLPQAAAAKSGNHAFLCQISAFEWHGHAPIGLKAGLDANTIEAVRVGKQPNLTLRMTWGRRPYTATRTLADSSRLQSRTFG